MCPKRLDLSKACKGKRCISPACIVSPAIPPGTGRSGIVGDETETNVCTAPVDPDAIARSSLVYDAIDRYRKTSAALRVPGHGMEIRRGICEGDVARPSCRRCNATFVNASCHLVLSYGTLLIRYTSCRVITCYQNCSHYNSRRLVSVERKRISIRRT